jgi:hypothetical protein
MAAALGRSLEMAQLLSKKGVPVDASIQAGWTALFYAVGIASIRAAEISLPKGPQIMWAEQMRNASVDEVALQLAKLLLEKVADPNRRNREGRTPLEDSTRRPLAEWNAAQGSWLNSKSSPGKAGGTARRLTIA